MLLANSEALELTLAALDRRRSHSLQGFEKKLPRLENFVWQRLSRILRKWPLCGELDSNLPQSLRRVATICKLAPACRGQPLYKE